MATTILSARVIAFMIKSLASDHFTTEITNGFGSRLNAPDLEVSNLKSWGNSFPGGRETPAIL